MLATRAPAPFLHLHDDMYHMMNSTGPILPVKRRSHCHVRALGGNAEGHAGPGGVTQHGACICERVCVGMR